MGSLLIDRRMALLGASAATLHVLISISRARAQAGATDDGWRRFVSEKFGTTIEYPPGFEALPAPDSQDGVTLVASDGARILAYASYNLEDQSLDDFAAPSLRGDDYARVTNRARGKVFLVVSGVRDIEGRESVFYERYYMAPDRETIHAVAITYPLELKATYDPLVKRIAGSLRQMR
jgi:hypothetical protein